MKDTILLNAHDPQRVGEVVTNLLRAGNAVEVTGETIADTLLVKIQHAKPVNAETRARKAAWAAKIEAAKTALRQYLDKGESQ